MSKGTIKCYDPLCEKHPKTDWHKQALDNEKVIQDLAGQLAAAVEALEKVRVKIRAHNETITQRVTAASEIIDAALEATKATGK